MSDIINMFDRKPKPKSKIDESTPAEPVQQSEQKPIEVVNHDEQKKDPWWFMKTPYSTTIGHEEKSLIHHSMASSVPLGYLIQLAEHHPTLTIKEFVRQQMTQKES
jgi:hypothetical protein